MSRAISPVTGKSYGLAAVCRVWRLARSGIYRHLSPSPATPPRRRGPRGAMTDDALTTAIRGVLAVSFQQVVHPVLTEEAEVAETSDSKGEPDDVHKNARLTPHGRE